MFQIFDSAIVEQLPITLNNCIDQSLFPDVWENSNIWPIHKKVTKKLLIITHQYHCYLWENTCYTAIYGKNLERLILTLHMNMLRKINYYQPNNLVLV